MNTTFCDPIAFAVECHQKGEFAEAERVYRELLDENPSNCDALHLLGMLAHDTGQPEKALGLIAQAIQFRPDIAYFHSNLGNVFQRLQRFQDAELCYREALRLDPGLVEAHNNLGNALSALHYGSEAMACYLAAIQLKPDYCDAYGNLAQLLLAEQRWEDAAACFAEAGRLALNPEPHLAGRVAALDHWGRQLRSEGNHDGAIACYRQALALNPGNPDLHVALAHSLLITAQLEAGWKEFEWRWRVPGCPTVDFEQPVWDGSPLAGKRILLWAEQGLGDTIQFVRFAEIVTNLGGVVLFECQPQLEGLLRTCSGIDELIPYGSPLPAFDVHAPLQSLPGILNLTVQTIPVRTPYLAAGTSLAESWNERLGTAGKLRVGLVWAGSPANSDDATRSIPLETLGTLGDLPGIAFFSLQKGPAAREQAPPGLVMAHPLESTDDICDTAAVIQNLDLTISVDTFAAHLSGALGRRVWTLLSFAADWRWLHGREDSPWYPTMRLFRQPNPGDWKSVVEQVKESLRALCQISKI